jgi:hypothetical protein
MPNPVQSQATKLRWAAVGLIAGVVCLQSQAQSQAPQTIPVTEPRTANSAEDDRAFIIDFLEKGYLQAWFAHPSSVRQHFADPVEVYWTRRNVPLKEVVQDKLSYARKWIFRFYRLLPETVKLEPVTGRSYGWKVTFTYEFIADQAPPRSQGTGETTLLLEVIGDQVKIHGESGRILDRKRNGE